MSVLIEESFNKFWEAYPRKVAKQDALDIWEKIKPDNSLIDKIIQSVEQQRRTAWKDDLAKNPPILDYIPHPATFLNGKRWTDELGVQSSQSKPEKCLTCTNTGSVKRRTKDGDVWLCYDCDCAITHRLGSQNYHVYDNEQVKNFVIEGKKLFSKPKEAGNV